jgi:hypothetical protein
MHNKQRADVRRRRASGRPVGDAEQRLERLRHDHYQTRLDTDRAEHG